MSDLDNHVWFISITENNISILKLINNKINMTQIVELSYKEKDCNSDIFGYYSIWTESLLLLIKREIYQTQFGYLFNFTLGDAGLYEIKDNKIQELVENFITHQSSQNIIEKIA